MAASVMLTAPWAQAAPGGGGGGGPGPWVKLSGTVTNSYSGLGIAGATITLQAGATTITIVTDANGDYSDNKVPVGFFTMTTSAPNYPNVVQQVSLLKGRATVNVSMTPNARVIVTASLSGSMAPGDSPTATGSFIIMDGSTLLGTSWSQTGGVPATIADATAGSTSVTLGNATDYAAHLISVLEDPPITAADLPPDLVLQPINQIRKGLQDRNQVVAINPMGHEHAAEVDLKFAVTTTSGTYSASINAAADLPWQVSTGVRTVPVGQTVLMYAKNAAGYNWTIAGPAGSQATLTNSATQTPWFTPDQVGTYVLTETNSNATVEVHAGRYHGVIDPLLTLDSLAFGDGRPVADQNCTGCHTVGGAAPANFDTWRNTGHAEAFTQGITTNSHFGENCFACHAVGFGKGGIDSTPDYQSFIGDLLAAQHATPPSIGGLWTSMLTNQPAAARLSNIQCENCHGPQDYAQAHHTPDSTGLGEPRVNLGAETCGSCHGEPARHGRFQQWQISNHADYNLARSRGASSGNCARCHSGNGFIAWSELGFDPLQQVTVTWNQDTVVPQVCAACHDPHDTGTTSGTDGTDAKVRVMGDTHMLLAGFVADNVGKGATCMTCHNSRADYPRNDSTWTQVVANNDTTDRPHHGVQADLIMGQNMYFTGNVPQRGKHSFITDTCVTCHMNATQPPSVLSYNQSGTNHTFAADPNVCSNCHGPSDPSAATIDAIVTGYMNNLQVELGAAYKRMMVQNYPVNVGSTCGTADGSTVTVSSVVWNERATRLNITLSNGNSCTNRDPASIIVDAGGPGQQSLFALSLASNDGAVLKAAWNWSMQFEDETINGCDSADDPNCNPPHTHRGVHNPDFAIKGLTGAIAAVQAVAP